MYYIFPTVIVLTAPSAVFLFKKVWDLLYIDCLTVIIFKLGSFPRL